MRDTRTRWGLVALITALLIGLVPIGFSGPTYLEFGANVRFIPTGSGPIYFSHDALADSAYFSGGYIYFTGLMIKDDGYTADIWGASTSTYANLTVNGLLEGSYNFTVNAPSGNTSTTDIRMPTDALVSSVSGASSWVQVGNVFTFIVVHSSPAEVIASVGGGAVVPPLSGDVSAGDVWIGATDDHYPPLYDGTNDGGDPFEDALVASWVNTSLVWENDTWDISLYSSTARVDKTTGDDGPAKMVVYKYDSNTTAGALYGLSDEYTLTSSGTHWTTFIWTTPVDIPDGEYEFYLGIMSDAIGGNNDVIYNTGGTEGQINTGGLTYPTFPDPWVGEASVDKNSHVRAYLRGANVNTTLFNQYYGDADDYLARRDIDVTFPGSSTEEWVNFSLPRSEYIFNITYPVGGVWNSSLTSAQYIEGSLNDTHNLVSIPAAALAVSGPDFRVYSRTYDYYGTLRGPFYENGTAYPSTVTVTMVSANGTDTIDMDMTNYTWGTNDEIIMFYWSLQSGGVRRVYVNEVGETITVFMPEANYATYEFDVRDYTGKLDKNAYLEAWRVVNSTEALIERSRILDAVNDVPLSLVQYTVYNLRVVFSDGSIYVFGYLVTGVDPTPTISIQDIQWGDQAHTTSIYITMDASRPTSTTILASYLDETPADYSTTLVSLSITYRDGTVVYSTSQADSKSVVFSWNGANATRDYVVRVTATQVYFGTISRVWVLDASRTFSAFPNLDALGSWGFDTTNLLTFGVSLIVALCFSFAGRWLAPFAFMSTVGAFTYLGATDLSGTQVGIGFVLAIVMGAVLGGRDQ